MYPKTKRRTVRRHFLSCTDPLFECRGCITIYACGLLARLSLKSIRVFGPKWLGRRSAQRLDELRYVRTQRYLMQRRTTGVSRSLSRCRKVWSASHIFSPMGQVVFWPKAESLIYTKLYAPDKLGMLSMLVEMLPSTIS